MIEVSGQVADATIGDGIPSATIAVNGKPIGSTDSKGNFTVTLDSYNDTITASSVGYASLTLPAYQVQESGIMQLGINAESLAAATVTPASNKSSVTPWLVLAGIVVIASSSKSHSASVSGNGSKVLIPVALLGLGAYFLLKPSTTPVTAPIAPYAPTNPVTSPGGSILNNTGLNSLANLFKGLFGGSSSTGPGAASFVPVGVQPIPGTTAPSSPAGGYTNIPITAPTIPINPGAYGDQEADIEQYADEMALSGMGDTGSTTFSAGDIIGHTLIAATTVPLYNDPTDDATPVGTVTSGNPVGVVTSWLDANPAEGRNELWWQFQNNSFMTGLGDSQGNYYVPHKEGYFNVQALIDSGVLTVAQATALKNASNTSTLETLVQKYLPWVLGAVIAVGIGKAVINKAL